MFIGHYGLALGTKRVAPRVSLGASVAAAQLVDLVWPVLLLLGVEHVQLASSTNPFLRLEFTDYPWTHSLLMGVVWGVVAGAGYAIVRRNQRGGIVIGLLVVSHWVLDLVVHVADLPLYPRGPRVGLGLWQSFTATMIVESIIFVAGLVAYARATAPRNARGRWGFVAFAVFLAVLYVGNAYGPPPTSVDAVAWGALAGWLVPLFGWWVDRNRQTLGTAARAHGA